MIAKGGRRRWGETKKDLPQAEGPCFFNGSPKGIRTPVFGLRTRRPGPLDDGTVSLVWLGNLDSNQDYLIQSQACCRCTIPQRPARDEVYHRPRRLATPLPGEESPVGGSFPSSMVG